VIASALAAYGRYAPARALALPDPGPAAPYVGALRHYARGEALASRGALFRTAARTPARFKGAQSAVVRIAVLTLRGRAAMLGGQPRAAVAAYQAAAGIQADELAGRWDFDPPPWWYPERRSLAAAMLAAGQPADAAREARIALGSWPHEPLTLEVLSRAETALGERDAAARHRAEVVRTWRGGPVTLATL
jgi:hypothetical protein